MPSLLYVGILSGGLAYTLQIVSQKHTPPAEAALILSLEIIFAALGGSLRLGDQVTLAAGIGCALILCAVLLVEIGPLLKGPRTS